MRVVGIDPSQRHTGLCVLEENLLGQQPPLFFEITTRGTDLLTSVKRVREEFRAFVTQNTDIDNVTFSMEKTVASGQSSQILFYVQMALFEEIAQRFKKSDPSLINPLPVQLKSYIWHIHKIRLQGQAKGVVVKGFRAMMGPEWERKRISSHLVEAYFLARMGIDVLHHEWEYLAPQRERPLVPWTINYGVRYV